MGQDTITKRELPNHMKQLLLPPVGSRLGIGNKLFKVTYHNVGKVRFTAEFVGEMDQPPEQQQRPGQQQEPKPGAIATAGRLIVTPEEAAREGIIV